MTLQSKPSPTGADTNGHAANLPPHNFQPLASRDEFARYFEARINTRVLGKTQMNVRCPLHDDSTASLSINMEKGLWKCHAGCGKGGLIDFEMLWSHCDHNTAKANIQHLLHDPTLFASTSGKKLEATYDYRDTAGRLVAQKLRFRKSDGKKDFRWRAPNLKKDDGWVWHLPEGFEKPLYNLDKLIAANYVVIVEGEKDTDNVAKAMASVAEESRPHNLAVTTAPDGASKPGQQMKWNPRHSAYFAGKFTAIIPDNDAAGRYYCEFIAKAIAPYAAGIKIVELPGLAEHGDVSDYLLSHPASELIAEIEKAPWMDLRTSVVESVAPDRVQPATGRPDMPENVLDGRLGEICQRRMARFPLAYSWGALLVAVGALIARTERQSIRPNLYWCAVGDVGTGKSQSFELAFKVAGLNEPVRLDGLFGSAEGLMENVDGEQNAVRLNFVDELEHLLKKCAIDKSALPNVLNRAYCQDHFVGGTKGKKFTFDCRLSLAGGLVESYFAESFGANTCTGLYDRFCFGLCPQPFLYFNRPLDDEASENISPTVPRVDGSVWECQDFMLKQGLAGRIVEQALKVAFICAAVDRREVLRGADLNPALQFAQYQEQLRRLLCPMEGQNPDAQCAEKIRRYLSDRAPNGEWVKRRDVANGIHAHRLGPSVFNRCLLSMQFNDEIELNESAKTVRLIVATKWRQVATN